MVDQQEMFDPARHSQPPPVVNFPGAQQPPKPAPPPQQAAPRLFSEPLQNVQPQYVQLARAVSQILATRILLLIAVITASAVWGYTIYDPLQLRIIAASSFSVLGVAPLIWLYFRKG